jgi:hypothetical protein
VRQQGAAKQGYIGYAWCCMSPQAGGKQKRLAMAGSLRDVAGRWKTLKVPRDAHEVDTLPLERAQGFFGPTLST